MIDCCSRCISVAGIKITVYINATLMFARQPLSFMIIGNNKDNSQVFFQEHAVFPS